MTAYCHRCGHWFPLDALTAWCGECTNQWNRDYATRGDPG